MKSKQKRYGLKLDILFAVIIGAFSLYNIPNLTQLYVLHDEFGYWANAALAVGHDWSDIAKMSPYYSYGYSLLLIPLLLLFRNPTVMYRVAIALNAVMYVVSYFVSLRCAKKLLPDKDENILKCICLTIALYGNNLLQANISWGEALLYLIFWTVFATLIKYLEEPKIKWLLCMGLEIGFMYVIHQRTLGVVVAWIMTCVLLFTKDKKIPWKKILGVAGAVIVLAMLALMIKNYVQKLLWNWQNEELAGHNDYAGQFEKILRAFTSLEGFGELIYSLAGKLFGMLLGSCGLVAIFLWKGIRGIFAKGKGTEWILYFFLTASLTMMMGVSAIFWIGGGRIDGVIYSRYTEFVVGPLLLIALGHLFSQHDGLKERIFYLLLVLISGHFTNLALAGEHTLTRIHNVAGGLFFNAEKKVISIPSCILFLLVMGALFFLAQRFQQKSCYVLVIAAMVSFWFLASRNSLDNEVNIGQKYLKELTRLSDMVEEIDSDAPIYYMEDPAVEFLNRRVENVQFIMPDRPIHRVERDEVEDLGGEHYLLQYGLRGIDLEKYEVAMQTYGMALVVPVGSGLAEQVHEYQRENEYRFLDTEMHSATSKEAFVCSSDYQEGFVTGFQDLVLNSGTYEVIMELEMFDREPRSLFGYYDVTYDYGEQTLFQEELTSKDVSHDGAVTLKYTFSVPEMVQHAEFRLYSYGHAKININSLSYRRVE